MTEAGQMPESAFPFLAGGGEMGALIRSKDWNKSPLGVPGEWPVVLKHMASMMLTTSYPVLICWGNDYIQLYNDAFRPINGETKHPQALGGSARDTYAEIWDTIGPMFKNVMNGQSISFPDFKVPLHRNGYLEDCYFDFSYSPIRDENGKIGGVLVICIETTQKMFAISEFQAQGEELASINEELAATNEEYIATNEELSAVNEELAATNEELTESQEALSRSEKLFRSIALNIPNSLIIMIDMDHRFITIEGDIMEKMGYNSRDYAGKHPRDVSPPERYEASRHLYDRMLAGEKFSTDRKAATGEDYRVHFVPLKNDQEEVEAGLIIALDITDIKRAEEESAKLAAIVETSDDAIISKTLDSVITSWNDSAERMFGYTADEIIGQPIYKLIPADRHDEEPRILARLKNGERVEHFETRRITRDGRLIDVSLTISPLRDKAGNITGLSKIARDITERKMDEVRKNDFIAMVSHELKTPLTSLHALIQVANAKLKNSHDAFLGGAMAKANMQVKKMTGMINGFLDISRLESGKMLIVKHEFSMDELVREIMEEVKLTDSSHLLRFTTSASTAVLADRDKIGSVISNLLSNAVKYSPRQTEILVNCTATGDHLTVSIQDHGVGISKTDAPKLFDRYYRAENPSTRHISGFGIGLYLSAEIIRCHGGKIWVESEPGQGSTFYFTIPVL